MSVSIQSKKSTGADPILARDQLQALQHLYKAYGSEFFIRQFYWILRKKPEKGDKQPKGHWNKRLIPFVLNEEQQELNNKGTNRNIILKGRQIGMTTFNVIRRLHLPAILEPGTASLLISQTSSYGAQHFVILHRAHKYFGKVSPFDDTDPANQFWQELHDHLLHTQYSARKELVYDMLDSRILVDSAENEEVGQGLPGISHLMCTEIARWPHIPEETLANVKEAVHDEGTVDLESTANGLGGYFYEEWERSKRGEGEFTPFFFEWWYHKEYREKTKLKKKDLEEEERFLVEKFKLDLQQIAWRRTKVKSLRREFKEKYPEDDISCFLTSGSKFFDEDALHQRYLELQNTEPLEVTEDGTIQIFVRRRKHSRYIIGADPATGRLVTSTDTDYCAAVVLEVESGEECAGYQERVTPEEFGLVCVDLARMYNNALVAVERTGDGGTVMLAMRNEGYDNVYYHREWDRVNRTVIELPGWPPTTKTRPIACNRLAAFVREHPEMFYDMRFIHEAFSFIREGKKGRPEAQPGSHDDTVSARYIAHYIRLVLLGYIDPIESKSERYGLDIEAA